MIRSMTAFGRHGVQQDWGSLHWELRSVNHRYLEVSTRLPEDFRSLEMPIRTLVGKKLGRGKVECNLRFKSAEGQNTEFTLNTELAKKVSQASREIDSLLYNPAPINSVEILRWPGVMQSAEMDMDVLQQQAMSLLEMAIDELVETRLREGERLKTMLEQRLTSMQSIVSDTRKRLPDILQRMREKLTARLSELKAELDADRLEQEMVMLAQKMDVDEELERLGAHIDEVQRVLGEKKPVGRRLDFLMQELHREANTLGSKSVDTETTRASVDLKVLIEQMREQVQNIE